MRSSCGDLQSQRHLVARHRRALWWVYRFLVNGPRSPIGSGSAKESVPQEYQLWVPGDGEAARRRVDDAEATRRRVDDAEATRRRLDMGP